MSSIKFSTLSQLTEPQNPKNIKKEISIYDFDISTFPRPSKDRYYDTLNHAYGAPSKKLVSSQGCYM
jgi:hypothetical protein